LRLFPIKKSLTSEEYNYPLDFQFENVNLLAILLCQFNPQNIV